MERWNDGCTLTTAHPGPTRTLSLCEHGEGDCDDDDDCLAGTYCKRDSGPEFGFSDPDLDVCSNS